MEEVKHKLFSTEFELEISGLTYKVFNIHTYIIYIIYMQLRTYVIE